MTTTARRRQRGQALVEFGVVSVVLMFVMAGLLDLSRAIWNYNTLSQAVRGATRYAIVHGQICGNSATWGLPTCASVGPTANDSTLETRVKNAAAGMEPSAITVSSSWPNSNNRAGSPVTVSAVYNFTPVLSAFIGGAATLNLRASSRMTIVF